MDESDQHRQLVATIEATLAGQFPELEVVDVDVHGGRSGRLTVYIDRPGGVDLALCEAVTRALDDLRDRYALLHSGGALGRGCGPLIVARKDSPFRPADANGGIASLSDGLSHVRIAIPGELTTAALLSGLFTGSGRKRVVMPFDRIMPAVAAGEVDAGVIIHEGRFTFGSYGLRRLVDLGEWWERTTGFPIPLGGIAVSRALGRETQGAADRAIRESVLYAQAHPEASQEYVAAHSQEMDPAVCKAHIDLYVNDASVDYGPTGEQAIEHLLAAAAEAGLVEASGKALFWDR